MAYQWNDDPTEILTLSNDNQVEVRQVDLPGLVMSAGNEDIPNGLLEQVSANLSGQAPDLMLTCHSGVKLPERHEPVTQGLVRARVVDVMGDKENFTVRVALLAGKTFTPGEIRFGGINMATLASVDDYAWRLGDGDPDKAREQMPKVLKFIELIVRAASVKPKFVVEVTDPETEVALSRLKLEDKMKIFNWAMPREVRPAGTFPQRPAAGVAAAPDVQGLQPESGDGVRPDASVGALAVQP